MIVLPLLIIFLIPTYYIAKSKGYNAIVLCVIVGMVTFATPHILHFFMHRPLLPIFDITLPAFMLLFVAWILPRKKGAPGVGYMRITFNCPDCGESISFGREFEGSTVQCPKCEEIITVPLDNFSPDPKAIKRPRPLETGEVCFDSYGHEVDAEEMKELLESHGVECAIISNADTGALTQLTTNMPFKLCIDVKNWDKAVQIQRENQG